MTERAVISVSNDMLTDQRVDRSCRALCELGYEVLLIGRGSDHNKKLERPYPMKMLNLWFQKGFLFYAELNIRLFWVLLREKKHLLYANDLDTLIPNYIVSWLSNTLLVYDSHEYFTEVPELQQRPFVKSFWENLEKLFFPRLKNVITVNHKLADIYSSKYGVAVSVIRNVPDEYFRVEPLRESSVSDSPTVLIYQGSLNLGRGIELMIDCMEFLEDSILHIAGSGDIATELQKRVKRRELENRVFFKGRLNPEELRILTEKAALGFSLEEDIGLNYRYALPNKIFDYIHAGIPSIVSNLPLMSNLVSEQGVGEVLEERTPESLAHLVERVLSNRNSYKANIDQAAKKFNWTRESKTLQKFIETLE